MKRCLYIVLLATLPITGCSQPPPTRPAPGSTAGNGGTTNTSAPVSSDPTKDWYIYSAPEGNYSIKFPGKPEETAQSHGSLKNVRVAYNTASGRRGFISTSILFITNPNNYNVEDGLRKQQESAINAVNGALISEKKIDYKGAPGREYLYSMPNGTKVKERIYIVNKGKGPVLYQATVLDADGNLDTPETDLFLNSLEIKDL